MIRPRVESIAPELDAFDRSSWSSESGSFPSLASPLASVYARGRCVWPTRRRVALGASCGNRSSCAAACSLPDAKGFGIFDRDHGTGARHDVLRQRGDDRDSEQAFEEMAPVRVSSCPGLGLGEAPRPTCHSPTR
jgi:hypothetical protein